MSSCPGCFESASPEIVPVTINSTTITIDDSPAMFRTDLFSYGGAGVTNNKTLYLTYYPYEAKSITVFLNSGAQRYGVDYTVQGQYVILTNQIEAGDSVYVTYLHVSGTTAPQAVAAGAIVSSASTSLGVGFLLLSEDTVDGSGDPLEWGDYPYLQAWFFEDTGGGEPGAARRSTLLNAFSGSGDTDTFQFKTLYNTTYNGVTLVTLNQFISTGEGA